MDIIKKYFPHLSDLQVEQFSMLYGLYKEWNEKINVISRKDIDNLYVHHVLHSLAISKFISFKTASRILDVGTGGGFPGIPLAILFPDVTFHLIDSTGKKIKVTQTIAETIDLKNVTAKHCRIEEEKGKYDFVVSRAVLPLPDLVRLVRKNISDRHFNNLPNGLICLKGGDIGKETSPFPKHIMVTDIKDFFSEDYFETKKIIYLPL
jgi:16S rRNA (guanine527-N7)-methyltransferase